MLLIFSSCRKEEEDISLNEEDVAKMVGASLSDNSDAIEEQSESSAQLNGSPAIAYDTLCGNPLAYNRALQGNRNGRSFTYEANGTRDGVCVNDSLIAFQYTVTFLTSFNGPNYVSSGNGSRNGRLDEIRSDSTFYLWTGNSSKRVNGTLTTRRETYQITTDHKYNSELKIDKSIRRISSGITNFTISGSGEKVENFSYSGTITFLGSRQATIRVNGNSYSVNY